MFVCIAWSVKPMVSISSVKSPPAMSVEICCEVFAPSAESPMPTITFPKALSIPSSPSITVSFGL